MPRVMHFEIPADDPQRLTSFLEKVFGWRFQKWDGPMDYWLVMTGAEDAEGEVGIDGAIHRRSEGNAMVVNTVDVADIDEMIAKVEKHGGQITLPKMAVPTIGWMAYFKDPEGNIHGMMQSDPNAA